MTLQLATHKCASPFLALNDKNDNCFVLTDDNEQAEMDKIFKILSSPAVVATKTMNHGGGGVYAVVKSWLSSKQGIIKQANQNLKMKKEYKAEKQADEREVQKLSSALPNKEGCAMATADNTPSPCFQHLEHGEQMLLGRKPCEPSSLLMDDSTSQSASSSPRTNH